MKKLRIITFVCLYILAIDSNSATVIMRLTDASSDVGRLKMTIGSIHTYKEVTTEYDEHNRRTDTVLIYEDAPAKFDFYFNKSSGLTPYSFDSDLHMESNYTKFLGEIYFKESYVYAQFENDDYFYSPTNLQIKSLLHMGLFTADVKISSEVVNWEGKAEVIHYTPLPNAFLFMVSGMLVLLPALRIKPKTLTLLEYWQYPFKRQNHITPTSYST